MGIIAIIVKAILGLVLMVAYLTVAIGSLWVLRIALDWFWDWDYVAWLKGKGKNADSSKTD